MGASRKAEKRLERRRAAFDSSGSGASKGGKPRGGGFKRPGSQKK